jgi:hypothetical protein
VQKSWVSCQPHHFAVRQSKTILADGVTDPDGDPVTITISGITQDEPTHGLGTGGAGPDGFGVGASQAQL